MVNTLKFGSKLVLFAGLLASGVTTHESAAKALQGKDKPGVTPAVSSPSPAPVPTSVHATPAPARDLRSASANLMYRALWGIDNIRVRDTASGSLIRFSYRVVDAAKAKVLNDEKLTPVLIGSAGDKLDIPETENAGKLRQVAPPQNGREYWMVFLNNSRSVKPGSKVSIVIGSFRADGLVVEPAMTAPAVKKP